MEIFILLTYLTIKHFIVDALLQTKYQYSNKHIFLHFGGVLHALLHGIGTSMCFLLVDFPLDVIIIVVGLIDMVIHYFIDYIKMNITLKFEWSLQTQLKDGSSILGITSNKFFIFLLLDQCLHFLTYILLVYINTGVM